MVTKGDNINIKVYYVYDTADALNPIAWFSEPQRAEKYRDENMNYSDYIEITKEQYDLLERLIK